MYGGMATRVYKIFTQCVTNDQYGQFQVQNGKTGKKMNAEKRELLNHISIED
jgi:hypothetical protein